jgi:hypothetical protein
MLTAINKTLSPISGSTLTLSFSFGCNQEDPSAVAHGAAIICAAAKKAFYAPDGEDVFVEHDPLENYHVGFHYSVVIFLNENDARSWASNVLALNNNKYSSTTVKPAFRFVSGGNQ